ncbi:MAG: hypothetical protein ACYDIA_00700 [Candidatus Humimicrobiaceae bacterium]
MDEEQIEKLSFIVFSLKEFCYGLDRLDKISDQVEQGSAQMRFYMTSLYEYSARYLLIDKRENLPIGGILYPALEELGLENYLLPIINTLNEKIGSLDLQTILRIFRNKMITHSKFTFEPIEKKIYEIKDLRKQNNYIRFQELLQKLYDQIKELYVNLLNLLQQ